MKTGLQRVRRLALGLLLAGLHPGLLLAANDSYPKRPIKLIVPYSAGGSAEVAIRAIAEGMARDLGQPVLIDNRPGADGAIAIQAGIAAEADGYALVIVAASMVALPMAVKPPPFDMSDLAPISTLGDLTFGLFVPSSLPVKTTSELLAYASAQRAPLAYASISLAMDALSAAVASAAGVEMTRVPYRGGAQAITDLVGGRVHVFLGPIGNGLPSLKEGRVRLLATHPHRSQLAPDVPTLVESGVGAATMPMFMLVAAPARTPRPVVERLAQAVEVALRDPQLRERLDSLGVTGKASSPEGAAELIKRAQRDYEPVVQKLERSR